MAGKCKFRLDDGQIEVVDDLVAQILRTKTPDQRVAMIFHCGQRVRWAMEAGIRNFHPEWNDQQVAAEVARRLSNAEG